ncbi:MAG: hypothetical protein AB1647_03910 [Pseudomonadota bacterium]
MDHTFKHGFVVNEEALRRIHDIVSKHINESPAVNATLTDGVTVEFSSIDELMKFPNANSRQIDVLRIEGFGPRRDDDSRRSAAVAFHRNRDYATISLDLAGEDEQILLTRRGIEEVLDGTARYVGHTLSRWEVPIFWAFCVIFGGVVSLFSTRHFEGSEVSSTDGAVALAVLIALLALPIPIGILLGRARRYLFPIGVYEIGAGIERNRKVESIRLGLFKATYGVIGAILLTIYGPYIVELFSN